MSILSRLRPHRGLCCRDVNEFLAVYMDDGLDSETHSRFESHIRNCALCAQYLDQYRSTVDLVQEAEKVPEPPDVLVDATLAFLRTHYGEDVDGGDEGGA